MSRWWFGVTLVALASCDAVYGLHRNDAAIDAAPDAPPDLACSTITMLNNS